MATYTLHREQYIDRPLSEVFEFFSDARNLEAITPEWLKFEVITPRIELRAGTIIDYRLKWHGIPIAWKTEIVEWNPPHGFVDTQLKGPYTLWHHRHSFTAEGGGTRMADIVRYRLPLGFLGDIAHRLTVGRDLERVFDFRRKQIAARFPSRQVK